MLDSAVSEFKGIDKLTVVGVGLIGGSFALALKQTGLVKNIVGFGQNEANLKTAVALGVIDSYSLSMESAVKGADLVMLAVPLGAMASSLQAMQPFLEPQTIVTDAGSAKMAVIRAVESVYGKVPANFVPGHPIAGKEKSGVTAADAMLYQKHRVILTPLADTNPAAVELVRQLWLACGALVTEMPSHVHDEVFAATSHLPHILAFGLVDMLNEHKELGDIFQYTAGGFRDFTRIASSDATMWRDIALTNSDAVLKWLENYQQALRHMSELIQKQDGDALYKLFASAKAARDAHIVNKQPIQS
ncbi:prephenate dehydrogenase [Thiosulfativibrio zosterae]|uniref:prephenate dehydrogenase n=1 Tax=Thiosulfativibrio zosterae TaxID=2675053 RepID=A0A6F8PNG0_9GAMM|nr:prephenate dehydrogenase/arogenate dehydrogenase family protein [Thiosulfativibrio zosterae]BBP43588.1 hypothetical protein THMIRHAT_13340 [Thiosulfativibrio zosterae]